MTTARYETISSKQNPGILKLLQLGKNAVRKKEQLFVIEGIRELEKAVRADYLFRQIYFSEQLVSHIDVLNLLGGSPCTEIFQVTPEVYEKIAYRGNSGGIVAVVQMGSHELQQLKIPDNPLLVILEGVEKPGNLGAIFRTADAAGVDAVIISDPATDLYNPNAVRASLGCIFTVPSAIAGTTDAISWLTDRKISIFCTSLQASVPYHTQDYTGPSAIVMGSEATGLSVAWRNHARANIIIPMAGMADSLNVSTAASVMIFEARRQRGFGGDIG